MDAGSPAARPATHTAALPLPLPPPPPHPPAGPAPPGTTQLAPACPEPRSLWLTHRLGDGCKELLHAYGVQVIHHLAHVGGQQLVVARGGGELHAVPAARRGGTTSTRFIEARCIGAVQGVVHRVGKGGNGGLRRNAAGAATPKQKNGSRQQATLLWVALPVGGTHTSNARAFLL